MKFCVSQHATQRLILLTFEKHVIFAGGEKSYRTVIYCTVVA